MRHEICGAQCEKQIREFQGDTKHSHVCDWPTAGTCRMIPVEVKVELFLLYDPVLGPRHALLDNSNECGGFSRSVAFRHFSLER